MSKGNHPEALAGAAQTALASAVPCRAGVSRLKYLFGEFLLFDLRRPAWICQAPFPPPSDFDLRPEAVLLSGGDASDLVVAESWPIAESERRLAITRRRFRYIPSVAPRYYVSLDRSFEHYLADNFQGKTRKNIVRSVRKMEEGGALFRMYQSRDEMALFLENALKVSEKTYQARMLGVGLPTSDEFRRAVIDLANRGLARGYLLHYGGQPIAFAYCTCQMSTIYYSTIGYDPQHAALSPGTVLLYYILQHVFNEGRFHWFDFGVGEAQYKSVFSTGFRTCGDVYFFRLNPVNSAIVLAHATLDTSSGLVGRLLERAGFKSYVRKWLRRLRGSR